VSTFLKRLAARKRTPLIVACILATPLYFLSLMLASLALDRPRIVAWMHGGQLVEHFHPTAGGIEAKIWTSALIPSGILIAIGVAAVFIRFGTYIVCAAMLVISGALPHKLSTWQRHHVGRYPRGEDLIPDKWSTNLLDRGEWEHSAHETIVSLREWMIGLAILFALGFALADELRRRRGNREVPAMLPPAVAMPLDKLEGQSEFVRGHGLGGPL
jgi:energy-converting hydrogenase Eha subunit A